MSSDILAEGSWWFHICTVDNAGNWTSTVTVGPFVIDTTAPCPTNIILANQTLSETQTLEATSTATLGPSLIVNGTNIVVNAPTVLFLNGVEVGGTFQAGNTTSCP